jgi:hypothetical protein
MVAIAIGCRSEGAPREQLIGNYVYREALTRSTHAPESLVMQADGWFVQYYGKPGDPKADTNSGTWVLGSDARHRSDIYLYHFKRWEANDPAPLPAGSVGNFKAGVETSGRSVFIVLSDDTGKEFVKAGG